MKCRKSLRVVGGLVVVACLALVAWDRNEMSIYQLRVNTIRGANDTDTITIVNPTTHSGAVTLSGGQTITGDLTAESDIIMENDEMLRNDVDGDVEVIFNDDAVILGQVILDTSIAVSAQADNDLYEIIGRAMDTATNATDYATIQLKVTDNTTTAEDGQILMQYIVAGSEVTGLTLGANASGVETCLIRPNLTVTGDIDIDGNDLTSDGDLLITPGGVEVHINGGLSVGDITAVGDNNFKVVGTALFASTVEIDAGLDLDGDALTSDGDLLITPGGDEVHINGGLSVGDTTAVGDNNFKVVGTALFASTVEIDAGLDLDGDALTSDGDLLITPGGDEVHINGGLDIGGTSAVGDNNLNVVGTATVGGTATFNGTIAGDNNTTISGVSNITMVAGAELTVDGKYAVTGGDATTGLMVLNADVTALAYATQTNAFATVFGAAPTVVCTYTEDPGDVRPLFVTSVTASNFIANQASEKNYSYIAVGTRP